MGLLHSVELDFSRPGKPTDNAYTHNANVLQHHHGELI